MTYPSPSVRPASRPQPARLVRTALAALATGFALNGAAETGVAIQGGRYDGISTLGAQVAFGEFMSIERGGWRLVGYPELQLNVHRDDGDDLVQAGVFATFRAAPARAGLRPYIEAGLGANLFSRTDLGDESYSTRFQFGEHVGVGLAWGGNAAGGGNATWVGLRYSHYSNAGIKKPNPGLEALQLIVGHRF